jgi:acetylornithine deacetylase/succinyl-diaminopimelate desuccinylase-like protein
MEIRVRAAASDLHSGSYGGAVANPANALATIIARLKDADGRVTIPGFYSRVRDLADEERKAMDALPFSDNELKNEVGAPSLCGEEGFTTLERLWVRPTLDVNGLLSGYTGEGAKTVLPAPPWPRSPCAWCRTRTTAEIEEAFAATSVIWRPAGSRSRWRRCTAASPGWPTRRSRSSRRPRGRWSPPSAGSPSSSARAAPSPSSTPSSRRFGVPVVLLGFGLPGANTHAPDEWMSQENYEKGADAVARLYEELAETGVTRGES